MSRLTAVWKASPRKVLTAVSAIAVASIAVVGSGANFNSVSANPNNTLATGTLSHVNSKAGAAVLTATNMRPGGPASVGTVDITNSGTLAGVFTVSKSNVTNSDATNPLSARLDLVVKDLGDCTPSCTATPVTKYTGKLGALPATALGTYTANEEHRYEFSVSFPDAGSGGADNAYQGDNTSVQFDWESTSN